MTSPLSSSPLRNLTKTLSSETSKSLTAIPSIKVAPSATAYSTNLLSNCNLRIL